MSPALSDSMNSTIDGGTTLPSTIEGIPCRTSNWLPSFRHQTDAPHFQPLNLRVTFAHLCAPSRPTTSGLIGIVLFDSPLRTHRRDDERRDSKQYSLRLVSPTKHFSRSLAYDNARRHRVAGRDTRHHGPIRDTKLVNSIDPKTAINN